MTSRYSNKNQSKPDWRKNLSRLDGAYADGTLRAYRADIKCFEDWCLEVNRKPFPATPKQVAKFIAHDSERYSTSTIKRRLVAIGKIHRLMKMEDPVIDEEVKLAFRRISRRKFSRPRQALGLTKNIRDQLIQACTEDSLKDNRDKAIMAVGYDALTRRSELSALCVEDISYTENGAKIIIRRSKCDQFGNGRVAHLSRKTTQLLQKWLQTAEIINGPAFRSIKQNTVSPYGLHPNSINIIIKRAAVRAGLSKEVIQSLSGHSMRIGAAQDMMAAGLDILPIMAAGGWKTTNVVARYIENADLSPLLNQLSR